LMMNANVRVSTINVNNMMMRADRNFSITYNSHWEAQKTTWYSERRDGVLN
jgi:hypothetical protein